MTIIDGYNLLHVAGVMPRGMGPGGWERARNALLNVLAESLPQADRAQTIVVFDAAAAPSGLPQAVDHRGLSVRYAAEHESADALIEELVRRDSSPKKLIVVSSDHRVQKAARRRKATAIDSDIWFADLQRRRANRQSRASDDAPQPPAAPLSTEEVDAWVREFTADEASDERDPPPDESDALLNPFPPGYGEDLLEDSDE
jgi:uncharacterized protein